MVTRASTRSCSTLGAPGKPILLPAGSVRFQSHCGRDIGGGVVGEILAEFQLFTDVAVEGGDEGSLDGGALRIIVGVFGEQIGRGAGEAGVVAAGGEAAAALEFGPELGKFDAQIGFDEIVLAEAGEAGEFFRDVGFFGGGEVRAFHQGCGIFGGGELTGFGEEGVRSAGGSFSIL